jgi:hypothetical protein
MMLATTRAQRLVEAEKDNHLFALFDRAFDLLDRVRHFGQRKFAARSREAGQQAHALAGRSVARLALCTPASELGLEQDTDDRADFAGSRVGIDFDGQPGAQLGGEIEYLVLGTAQHRAVQLNGQLIEVRRAIGHPAELVLARVAIALGEGEEAPAQRVAEQLQQGKQIARAVGERRAREREDERLLFGRSH